jgi:hypothetical protein
VEITDTVIGAAAEDMLVHNAATKQPHSSKVHS